MVNCQEHRQSQLPRWRRLTSECVLAFHGVVATAWWWLTPGGFSLGHSRFWMNRVWPLALLAIAVFGIWAVARRRHSLLKLALLSLAVMWLAGAISARLMFPLTASELWWWGLLVGCAGVALAVRWDSPPASRHVGLVSAILVGAMLGSFVPWVLRGPDPSTKPIGDQAANVSTAEGTVKSKPTVALGSSVNVQAASGLVSIQHEPYRLQIEPLLSFEHISPDRCWSILIPPAFQRLLFRRVEGVLHSDDDEDSVQILYDSSESLAVFATDSHLTKIPATRILSKATYSHLNSFCALTVTGHRRLFLRFSPCREDRIEVLPADYPTGRPSRLAYRTADRFVVVEANSGEKGPFRELASGPLQPHDHIRITLEDESREVGSVSFHDWAAQSSIEPSPTAGWGLPQNAIEFQRTGDSPSDSVMIWLTLAATSVGRGWDTVGHSPGMYRNRMQVNLTKSEESIRSD